MLTLETVTLEFPLLVNITPSELLFPTVTFPKLRVLGLALSCEVAEAPVPDSDTVVGELLASLMTVRLPERAPEEEGANRTCKVALWPAPIADGEAPLVTVNAAPETVAREMVTDAVPPFVKVTLCVELLPTATFPKLMLVGLGDRIFEPADCMFAVV